MKNYCKRPEKIFGRTLGRGSRTSELRRPEKNRQYSEGRLTVFLFYKQSNSDYFMLGSDQKVFIRNAYYALSAGENNP